MHLDERIPNKLREQFASQTEHLHDLTLETIKPMFRGIETDDFNEGLLAGLAAAYQVLKTVPPNDHVSAIGAMIAVVSREIYKKSKE